jgi:transcriptional regulator with XRE-family HTH domain
MIRAMSGTQVRTRRRVVVDQRALATAIGSRIRRARLAVGLTQQELAGDRYTKAYISALELGHAKPSMAALDYLAPRLGTTPDRLLTDEAERWNRIDADLHLAAGRYEEAAQAYLDLAERAADPVSQGELLLGAGEAYSRLRRPQEAAGLLADAKTRLAAGGRSGDLKRVQYWQAYVHLALDDPEEGRRLLQDLLTTTEAESDDPDFEVRVRIGLAQIETEHGSPEKARIYLEEARDLAARLESRKRAVYYDALAKARFASGDLEAAVRAGMEALSLFRAAQHDIHEAFLENELAMSFIALGNLAKAEELVRHAIRMAERLDHQAALGHFLDTEATIWLAREEPAKALELADQSLAIEAEFGPRNEQVGARITRARALAALGRADDATKAWEDAGAVGRELASPLRRKRIFAAWAEALAAQGRHAEAYEVMRETL